MPAALHELPAAPHEQTLLDTGSLAYPRAKQPSSLDGCEARGAPHFEEAELARFRRTLTVAALRHQAEAAMLSVACRSAARPWPPELHQAAYTIGIAAHRDQDRRLVKCGDLSTQEAHS